MSIKAILTAASLLLGSSSLVFAQSFSIGVSPGTGVYVGPRYPAPYTYPYRAPYPQPYVAPSYPYSPYSAPYQYANPGYGAPTGFVNGQQWIAMNGAAGRISLYTYGQTVIRSIEVYYLDGRVRRLRGRRTLGPGNPRLDILIGRQPIRGIVIRGGGAGLSAGLS